MLELKRRPHQVVKIGQSAKLTVLSLGSKQVEVQIDLPGVKIFAPLLVGHTYEAEVDGYPLKVTLQAIDPARDGSRGLGEAVLGFEAPRELTINRAEREGA